MIISKSRSSIVPALLAWAGIASAQNVVRVPDAPSCGACTVSATRMATLGGPESDPVLDGIPQSVAYHPSFGYVVTTYGKSQVVYHFDESGRYVGNLGRVGQGPGEFVAPMQLRVLFDTLVVLDRNPPRLSYFTKDLTFKRSEPFGPLSLPVSDLLVLKNRRIAASSPGYSASAEPLLLHVFNMADAGRTLSFDRPAVFRRDLPNVQRRQLAAGSGETIWSVRGLEYVLEQWTLDGKLLTRLEREAPWFPGVTRTVAASPKQPPAPMTLRFHADSAGMLWSFILVPGEHWADGLEPRKSAQGTSYYGIADPDKYYDTVVEIIDPASRKVFARQRFDRSMALAPSAGVTVSVRETSAGAVLIDVWKLTLLKP